MTGEVMEHYGKLKRSNERWSEEHCERLLQDLDDKMQSAMQAVSGSR
jgi:hypothetical protein